jgi:hypothetical protein
MLRRFMLVTALTVSSLTSIALAAGPAQADSPPPLCQTYYDATSTVAEACADVAHFSSGVEGQGGIACAATFFHSTDCRAKIARLRLYVNGQLWREVTNIGGDSSSAFYNISYRCWGVRLKFQVWMTYTFTWYNEFGQVHYIDNYQQPLTSYPEYSC